MRYFRSFQILALIGLLMGMTGISGTASTYADNPLTFNGILNVYSGNTLSRDEDSDWYSLQAAGQPVELILDYSILCGRSSARIDVYIGAVVGSISIPMADISQQPPVAVSGMETYTRIMPTSDSFQVGLRLTGHFAYIPPAGCGLNYTLTVSGATLSPILPPDPIIAAEEAAGLHRIQDAALPIVIYAPTAANPDRFIDIRDLEGNPLLYISADNLAALRVFPTENTLIASTADGFISMYKLTTGEYQVNVGPLSDGKIHVIIFIGIPPIYTYGYTLEMTDTAP